MIYQHENQLFVGKSIEKNFLKFALIDNLNLGFFVIFSLAVVIFGVLSIVDFGNTKQLSTDALRMLYLFNQRTITQITILNGLSQLQMSPGMLINGTSINNFFENILQKSVDTFMNVTKVNLQDKLYFQTKKFPFGYFYAHFEVLQLL